LTDGCKATGFIQIAKISHVSLLVTLIVISYLQALEPPVGKEIRDSALIIPGQSSKM
jgi:hypothetical protein